MATDRERFVNPASPGGDGTTKRITPQASINNGGAAVNKGGGLVGIPATAHGLVVAAAITISLTVAYNSSYTVHANTTVDEVVITETFT